MVPENFPIVPMDLQNLWRERRELIPTLSFPSAWRVRILPPFAGATVRFEVQRDEDHKWISVYLDFDHALGYYGALHAPEPYWEIYPAADGSTARFGLNDGEALLGAIALSLAMHERNT